MVEGAEIATRVAASEIELRLDIGQAFERATALHRQGQWREAEPLYRTILAISPDHFGALCGLGALRGQQGNLDDAVRVLRHAASTCPDSADARVRLGTILLSLRRPAEAIVHYEMALTLAKDHPQAHHRLADALVALSRYDEAIAHYEKILAIDPNQAGVHNNLGIALQAVGRLEAAVSHFRQAIAVKSDLAEAHGSLGNALRALDRPHDALVAYQRALAIQPGYADLHNNLAGVLHMVGRGNDAIAHYTRALAIRPDYAEAYFNLANLLREFDRDDEAIAAYQRAVSIKPDFTAAHNNLGNILHARGRSSEAIAHYSKALAIKPDYAEAHRNLGIVYAALNRNDEAIARYEKALAIGRSDAELHNNIGTAHHVLGRLDDAYSAYERAVALAPANAAILLNFASVKKFTVGDPRLAVLERLAADMPSLGKDARVALHFAMGKAFADLDESERAWHHFLEGNALKRAQVTYDEAGTLRTFERIAAVFTRALLEHKGGRGDPSEVPVFVVGMPRSGTTLIEQILASHSQVFGAGEREDFPALVSGLKAPDGTAFPEAAASMSGDDLRQLGARYLGRVRAVAPTAERIVDKLPLNFLYAGLIHLALPRARILHIRRDPIDTCCSCFSLLFTEDLPQTYDLSELGRYYRAYAALMAHWRANLPRGAILEVQYEDVVNDLEGQTRNILAHCGLPWEDGCLAFHETRRPVQTASVTQVRQPIYRSSIGRWRRYTDLLQPLLQALDGG